MLPHAQGIAHRYCLAAPANSSTHLQLGSVWGMESHAVAMGSTSGACRSNARHTQSPNSGAGSPAFHTKARDHSPAAPGWFNYPKHPPPSWIRGRQSATSGPADSVGAGAQGLLKPKMASRWVTPRSPPCLARYLANACQRRKDCLTGSDAAAVSFRRSRRPELGPAQQDGGRRFTTGPEPVVMFNNEYGTWWCECTERSHGGGSRSLTGIT